jgi:hypothetical protein
MSICGEARDRCCPSQRALPITVSFDRTARQKAAIRQAVFVRIAGSSEAAYSDQQRISISAGNGTLQTRKMGETGLERLVNELFSVRQCQVRPGGLW